MPATSRSAPPRPSRRRRRCWRASAATAGRYVSLLGSRRQTFFTDGGRELFDCAGQGRIDVFFLSGGQIDGEANINLVGIGDYAQPEGALSRLVRLVLPLLRRAQGDPVPARAQRAARWSRRSISSARRERARTMSIAPAARSRSSPVAACSPSTAAAALRARERASRPHGRRGGREHRLRLRPAAARAGDAGAPSPRRCGLLRTVVAPQLIEVYPQFAAEVFGVGKADDNAAVIARAVTEPSHRRLPA